MDQPDHLSEQGAGGSTSPELSPASGDPSSSGGSDPGGRSLHFEPPPPIPEPPTDLGRDFNGSARVAATIAALSSSLESWKADMARASARGEERLLRALEILESRMAQNQATVNETRDSVNASAAWLTRAVEEWKAEFRYGSGLSEVRLLSAIEALEARVGQVEYTENHTRLQLEQATTEVGRNLEERLETVKAAQDETRGWLEAAATALANDAQSALARLRDLRTSMEGLRGENRENFAEAHSFASESRLALTTRFNEVLTSISSVASASAEDRSKLRAEIAAGKDELVLALGNGVAELRSGDDTRHAEVRDTLTGLRDTVTGLRDEILEATGAGISASHQELSSLRSAVEEWRSLVGESANKTEARLLKALEALEKGILDSREAESQIQERIGGVNTEFSAKLAELETKLETTIAAALEARLEPIASAATESRSSIDGFATNLQSTLQEWREQSTSSSAESEAKLVAALETLESRITAVAESRHDVEDRLVSRMEELQNGVARVHEETDQRQERLESSLRDLLESIDDWRAKGRQAAQKNKDRISLGLQALENRILEYRDDEEGHRIALFKELDSLANVVESGGRDGRNYDRVMQGLEELDQELLRNRDDLGKLADTFESQFEIFESRIGRAVSSRVDQLERTIQDRVESRIEDIVGSRLDALERTIDDRMRVLAELMPGSSSGADPGGELEARIRRAVSEPSKAENEPSAGPGRRRRR